MPLLLYSFNYLLYHITITTSSIRPPNQNHPFSTPTDDLTDNQILPESNNKNIKNITSNVIERSHYNQPRRACQNENESQYHPQSYIALYSQKLRTIWQHINIYKAKKEPISGSITPKTSKKENKKKDLENLRKSSSKGEK